jgi:adenine-specific DNA-methyltransferase
MQNLLEVLKKVLKKDERCVVKRQLLKNKIMELVLKNDKELLKLLLSNKEIKKHFFTEVEKIQVFDREKFIKFVSNKQFLPDSYTAFKNKIGLTSDGQYLSENKDVVLAWPYKDCVLEGGQIKEDVRRDAVVHNEILASDQIDRLLDPKVLTNFKKYDKDGEHKLTGDEKIDFERENLIIKGNNLIALHTLKERFAGEVKLIYIDPPYNTGNDGFNYNNSFNQTTWLTFMKNRLKVAKELLREDGVIAISIDDKEYPYLRVLCEEIFKTHNYVSTIVVENNPKGRVLDKHISTSHEYLLLFSKSELTKELVIPKSEEEVRDQYPEKDKRGYFRSLELRNTHREFGKHNRPNLFYPIYVNEKTGKVSLTQLYDYVKVLPIWEDGLKGCWTWSKDKLRKNLTKVYGRRVNKNFKIYRKAYAIDKEGKIVTKKLKSLWMNKSFYTDKGRKSLDELVGRGKFYAPKPVEYIKQIVRLVTSYNEEVKAEAVILDFFSGSGTTAQAVMELNREDGGNRKFILVEQLEYVDTITTERARKVIEKVREVSFIRLDLAQWNELFVKKVRKSKSTRTLLKIWEEMKKRSFLSYKIEPKDIDENIKDFKDLSFENQKKFLIELLDKNYLYIPYSEIEDREYGVSEVDKRLNKMFYKKEGEKLLLLLKKDYKDLIEFREGYEGWYSESLYLVKQILSDRYEDFKNYYDRKSEDCLRVTINYTPGKKGIDLDNTFSDKPPSQVAIAKSLFTNQLEIVKSAESKFESSLFDIRALVQVDLFDSEIDAAEELNKKGHTRGAGAVAGVVLEGHLSQVCEDHKITVRKKDPTINDYNQLLKDNNVIEIVDWRFIQQLADLRNLCDHKKKKEPKKEVDKELNKMFYKK